MNCKPNELARVISTKETDDLGITDKIIRVTVLDNLFFQHWRYEAPHFTCPCGCGSVLIAIPDDVLRPIRGDENGADEMLLKVGKPGEVTA